MGAQIILFDGFEVVPPPEMNDLILFGSEQSGGSNCDESTVTTEEDSTVFSGDSSPGRAQAEEEWPEEETTPFSFYIVKQPAYDDPEIKAKIDEADSEIYQFNKLRIDLSNAQKSERAEISSLLSQMESLVIKCEGDKVVFEEKMKDFDTLHESLRNLRCSVSDQLCVSKEELDHLIYIAHYVIEHGSTGFEEEDWVLKETEKPDGLIPLSEESLAKKEAFIQSLKAMAVELNEVRKEVDAITWNLNHLSDKMGKSQNKIKALDVEMAHVLEKRDRSYERIKMLRIRRDRGNAAHFQNLAVMRKAKELAATGNVRDLEVFASSEVDRFMSHWNNDKAFRDDYVKRTSQSLYERQLSRDGRVKDREKQAPVKTRKEGVALQSKNRDDSSSNSSQNGEGIVSERKVNDLNRSSAEESDVVDLVYESPKKEEEEVEVDEETLKERKREEQAEKARLAMERKRKLQEKAAAKAAVRAQKEAEKKLKECEKKAKKKAAAANSPSRSESNQSREANNGMEKVRTLAVSGKERIQKEERLLFPKQRSFRYKHRGRGTEALPKAILNRRKAHRYWVWGLSSAALALALVLVFLLFR
ncbi:unnamed protein product [Microthlaspi erraticum]|uniref:Uncharacterized protein n=1 Tax=Microthlaspi erraticum TaxID=1685480 RepID=A0A6D2HHB4_9BRAS|nr:unnamed protein product [Microthlaspi erraticum]